MTANQEAVFQAWLKERDFWKSDESDWRPKWELLSTEVAGIGGEEIAEFIDDIIGLTKAEYGE